MWDPHHTSFDYRVLPSPMLFLPCAFHLFFPCPMSSSSLFHTPSTVCSALIATAFSSFFHSSYDIFVLPVFRMSWFDPSWVALLLPSFLTMPCLLDFVFVSHVSVLSSLPSFPVKYVSLGACIAHLFCHCPSVFYSHSLPFLSLCLVWQDSSFCCGVEWKPRCCQVIRQNLPQK